MTKTTKNAREILPKHLYEEVCKYGSGHWWFAPDRLDHKDTVKQMVFDLKTTGMGIREIAEKVNRTVRRVQQILANRNSP